eukprot:UN19820
MFWIIIRYVSNNFPTPKTIASDSKRFIIIWRVGIEMGGLRTCPRKRPLLNRGVAIDAFVTFSLM